MMAIAEQWRSPLDPERITEVNTIHWEQATPYARRDQLAVEEPLEIRLNHCSVAIIMRTPGHDRELALGFLLSEGIIQHANELLSVETELDAEGLPLPNVINITLHSSLSSSATDTTFQRHFSVSSSCGLCGKNSIAEVHRSIPPIGADDIRIPISTLYQLNQHLRKQQTVFSHTGGLHAAGLFTPTGELLLVREDIGRHNAVDKLIGYGLMHARLPYSQHILLVSGRSSFEIIQKALIGRIPCIAAISAPSSLAVDFAHRSGITLVGFLRDHSLNVYTHSSRIS